MAAQARARSMLSGGPEAQNSAREIACVSAEWNVVAQLIRDGSDPADCVLVETGVDAIATGSSCQTEATGPDLVEFWDRPG